MGRITRQDICSWRFSRFDRRPPRSLHRAWSNMISRLIILKRSWLKGAERGRDKRCLYSTLITIIGIENYRANSTPQKSVRTVVMPRVLD